MMKESINRSSFVLGMALKKKKTQNVDVFCPEMLHCEMKYLLSVTKSVDVVENNSAPEVIQAVKIVKPKRNGTQN